VESDRVDAVVVRHQNSHGSILAAAAGIQLNGR
jgi:hypothetical protein